MDEPVAPADRTAPERTASVTPADSSRLSLDWAATYSGVVPCASCPGIATTVTLNDDLTFERTMRYIDESPIPVVEQGAFAWNDAGSAVTLTPQDGEVVRYQVGEHRLFQLDQQGQRIEGELAGRYVLDQHLADPRIENRRWRLVELRGDPVDAAELHSEPFLELRPEDSRLHGDSSCNTFNGVYAIKSGQRIEFGENIAMTTMACPDIDIEQRFTKVLTTTANYSIGEDGSMTFNRARMAPLARFVEADPTEP